MVSEALDELQSEVSMRTQEMAIHRRMLAEAEAKHHDWVAALEACRGKAAPRRIADYERLIDEASAQRLEFMGLLDGFKAQLQIAYRRIQCLQQARAGLLSGDGSVLATLEDDPVVMDGACGRVGAAFSAVKAALRRPRLKKVHRHVALPPAFGAGPRRSARRRRH